MLKNIKSFEKFINENNKHKDEVEVTKQINTKEREIISRKYTDIKPSKLSERGADLKNEKVMKKGENPESLNVDVDSERLEYVWRYLSHNVDKALKEKVVKKGDKVLADNITLEGDKVVFDFIFKDSDSVQNTDPSGQTKKKILAGKIIPGGFGESSTRKSQVWALTKNKGAVSLAKLAGNKLKYAQEKRRLLEAGFKQIEGTYDFKTSDKGVWLDEDKVKQEDFDSGKYRFDESSLYKKFNITPK